ncbi:MAG: hypothetical protein PUP93_16240 [Rhizonema sp. NSF051]|nr:hypothetical protein [Rhizonema sp. NSF051]
MGRQGAIVSEYCDLKYFCYNKAANHEENTMLKKLVLNAIDYADYRINYWDYHIIQIPRDNTTPIPTWFTDESINYFQDDLEKLGVKIYECDRWNQYHLVPGANVDGDNRRKAAKVIATALKKIDANWRVI